MFPHAVVDSDTAIRPEGDTHVKRVRDEDKVAVEMCAMCGTTRGLVTDQELEGFTLCWQCLSELDLEEEIENPEGDDILDIQPYRPRRQP